MVLLLLMILILPGLAAGYEVEDFAVSVGLYTHHVDPGDDTNEDNGLLAFSMNRWVGARLVNSYHDPTYFAGRKWQTRPYRYRGKEGSPFVQGNLYAGLMHGYKDHIPNIGGVTVGLLPTLGFGWKRLSLEMLYVPTPKGGVFTSFLTWEFKAK